MKMGKSPHCIHEHKRGMQDLSLGKQEKKALRELNSLSGTVKNITNEQIL